MSPHYGRHREPAANVREELSSTLEVLVDDVTGQHARVDLQKNEVGSATEVEVGNSRGLVSIRAVNEPFGIKPLGDVHASASCFSRFRAQRDVEDLLQAAPLDPRTSKL